MSENKKIENNVFLSEQLIQNTQREMLNEKAMEVKPIPQALLSQHAIIVNQNSNPSSTPIQSTGNETGGSANQSTNKEGKGR